MRKIFLNITLRIALIVSVLAGFVFFPANISADVGEAPMPGGSITTGDKVKNVGMAEETVTFDIKNVDSDDCPFEIYTDTCWYADVEAEFIMRNESASDESIEVFYPFPSMLEVWGGPTAADDHSKDFKVEVDSEARIYEIDYLDYEYESDLYSGMDRLPSLTFPVKFRSGSDTEITISYKTRFVFEPKSHYGTFLYIMNTGSHWDESIGEGRIIFDFPQKPVKNMFKDFDKDFQIEGNKVVWEFEDLEPEADDDIAMTFSPTLLELWEDRNDAVAHISNKEDRSVERMDLIENFGNILPSGYDQYPGSIPTGSSPLFLLEDELPSTENDYSTGRGWFSSIEDPNSIIFEFDGVYEIKGLEIFTGVPVGLGESDTGDPAKFFDLYDRPKTLRLKFSNGETEEIGLEDKPDELMEIEFADLVETSSVEISVKDTYPSKTGDSEFLGISRLYLDIGDRTGDADPEDDEDSSSNGDEGEQDREEGSRDDEDEGVTPFEGTQFLPIAKDFLPLVLAVCTAGFVFLLAVVGGGYLLIKKKKNKSGKKKSDKKTAKEKMDTKKEVSENGKSEKKKVKKS